MESPSSPSSSSCSSSYPSPFSSEKFASLPITAMKEKIVDKIMENRVTLIVGETGCGKSSQVPLFLREANMTPVICTQPRRFAVVAVAKMVASVVQCEVGDEVGYHIGHSKVMSSVADPGFLRCWVTVTYIDHHSSTAYRRWMNFVIDDEFVEEDAWD